VLASLEFGKSLTPLNILTIFLSPFFSGIYFFFSLSINDSSHLGGLLLFFGVHNISLIIVHLLELGLEALAYTLNLWTSLLWHFWLTPVYIYGIS